MRNHKGFKLVSFEGSEIVLKKSNSFGDQIIRIIDGSSIDLSDYIELVFPEGSWVELTEKNIKSLINKYT